MYLNWEEFAAILESLCLDTSALVELAAQLEESWMRVQEMMRRIERLKQDLANYLFDTQYSESDPPKRERFRPEKGSRRKAQHFVALIPWYTSGFQ